VRSPVIVAQLSRRTPPEHPDDHSHGQRTRRHPAGTPVIVAQL
jgi:hypothetical protein